MNIERKLSIDSMKEAREVLDLAKGDFRKYGLNIDDLIDVMGRAIAEAEEKPPEVVEADLGELAGEWWKMTVQLAGKIGALIQERTEK